MPSPEDELAGTAGRGEDVPTYQPKKKALTLAALARVAKKRNISLDRARRQAEMAGYTVVDDSPRPVTADSGRVTGDGGATLQSAVIPGAVAGVANVFRKRTLDERGQPKTGLSLDEMLDRLRQDARFQWLESTDDLVDAIVDASRHPIFEEAPLRVGATLVMNLLFSPWVYTFQTPGMGQVTRPAGYTLIFRPPSPQGQTGRFGVTIDLKRLGIQTVAILVVVLVASGWGLRRRSNPIGDGVRHA